ncbi:hypothetical protein D3C87_104490 [compost metagenome]
MKLSFRFLALTLATTGFVSTMARAQEGAPQEPPFVEETNEFGEVMSIEDEVFSAELPPEPTQEEKDTVNLNEKVPEAGSSIEDEFNEAEEGPIISTIPEGEIEPATAAPSTEPARTPRIQRQSAKGGVEYIEHPQAAKGLMRIEKDGTYVYRIKDELEGKKNQSASLKFGSIDPPRITAADGTTFMQMYTSSMVPVLLFDYEWQPFEKFGKLGISAGFGFITASGNGRFLDGAPAEEKYTFIAVPLNAGLVYRMEFSSTQWVAPYVSGGGTYMGVVEMRDDGKTPSIVGVPGAYGAAGVLFNITALSRDTAYTLRNEYAIQNLWVNAEYRHLQTFNEELDFSSGIINVGVAVDY